MKLKRIRKGQLVAALIATGARDKVVGYTPRVRVDILLEDGDVESVLDTLRKTTYAPPSTAMNWADTNSRGFPPAITPYASLGPCAGSPIAATRSQSTARQIWKRSFSNR